MAIIDVNDIIGKSYGSWYVIAFDHIDETKQIRHKNTKGEIVLYPKKEYKYICSHVKRQGLFWVTRDNILKQVRDSESKSKLYQCWLNMKSRCYYPNNTEYKNYGGRGIKVCDEWIDDYSNFKDWATNSGYEECLTIDRIDVNKNYEPSNCRWVDMKVQGNNTTRNHYITYNGKTQSMQLWAEELDIPYTTLRKRLNSLDWTVEEAFEKEVSKFDCKNGVIKDHRNRTYLETKYGLLYIQDLNKVFRIDKSTINKYIKYYPNSSGDETLEYYINKCNITDFENLLSDIRTFDDLNIAK